MHQTLGLVHAVVHDHGGHVEEVGSQLFSGHDDDSPDCRLYDQSGHCDAMVLVSPLMLPLAIAPFPFSILTGLAVARWHALFQARGPPLIR